MTQFLLFAFLLSVLLVLLVVEFDELSREIMKGSGNAIPSFSAAHATGQKAGSSKQLTTSVLETLHYTEKPAFEKNISAA